MKLESSTGSRCAQRWAAFGTVCVVGLAAALASGAVASAASLVPVIVNPDTGGYTVGASAQIQLAEVYNGQTAVNGSSEPWGLDGYRISAETANATMEAKVTGSAITADSYVGLIDDNVGDIRGPEGNPQFTDAWFLVTPTSAAEIGGTVDLHLGLAWETYPTPGAMFDADAYVILDGFEGCCDDFPRLFRKNHQEVVSVQVGGIYKVGLWHSTEVLNGNLLSTASLYAGLEAPSDFAAADPRVPGDYNLDGMVNAVDYTMHRDAQDVGYDFMLDGDGSGALDHGDYDLWTTWYGVESPEGSSAAGVPEPESLLLLTLLASSLATRPGRMAAA